VCMCDEPPSPLPSPISIFHLSLPSFGREETGVKRGAVVLLWDRLGADAEPYKGNPDKPHVKFSTELKGHSAPIEKVAFNPTKDAELCSVSSDGVVKFWDVRTKACFNEVKGLDDAFTLAWAPDGKTLVVGNKVRLHFWLLLLLLFLEILLPAIGERA
jgi:WD40 repeat protein